MAVLDRQVMVMFGCATDVLAGVRLAECLHPFDDHGWTVHEHDGHWFGELGDEPPDVPTPTLAWTMWHPIWWLRTLIAYTNGAELPQPRSVEWPGPDHTLPMLRDLWAEWMSIVDDLDEDQLMSSELTRFPYTDDRAFVHIVGWSAMELVKNLSEICLMRRLARDMVDPDL